MRAITLFAAATLTCTAALQAGAAPPAAKPAPKPAAAAAAAMMPDHGPVVAARQAAFKLSLAAFLSIKAGIARGDDVKTMILPASAIAGWGKAIPAMFPPGSMTPESEALPVIWTDRAGFEAAATAMSDAAGKLATLAKAGDTDGFTAQYAELGKSCGACHTKYRKAEEKK